MAKEQALYPSWSGRGPRTKAGIGLFVVAAVAVGMGIAGLDLRTSVTGEAVDAVNSPARPPVQLLPGTDLSDSTTSVRRWGLPGGVVSAPAPPPPTAPEPSSGQKPGTVRLPGGGTATLVRKEVGPDATLPVPEGVREATWWGAGLGAPIGATLLAGHVNFRGAVGPFNELWKAEQGQDVTVSDSDSKVFRYRISEIITLHKNELPDSAERLFSQQGPHRLVLVTCGGRWVGGDLGYNENRIVVATPQV
ncbi:class F sortase [Allokutzneria albata]|uniref:Sortase family protein n=1 Tax=Allokutzneria albata TaxID=211114 RepID=A0A1G9YR07_ALLAB|nr:class F sortase [Allokutzneria albata]SDN11025.1 Sortase family protein [Allokutzneria albata]